MDGCSVFYAKERAALGKPIASDQVTQAIARRDVGEGLKCWTALAKLYAGGLSVHAVLAGGGDGQGLDQRNVLHRPFLSADLSFGAIGSTWKW